VEQPQFEEKSASKPKWLKRKSATYI